MWDTPFIRRILHIAVPNGVENGLFALDKVLATSIVAARKGESGLALGNAIGSSTFNILFILGASSALTAIESSAEVFCDAVVLLVVTTVMCLWCWLKGQMSRLMGGVGILVYVVYIVYVVLR